MKKMARHIGTIPGLNELQRRIRRKRSERFLELMKPDPQNLILDVGGTVSFWMTPEFCHLKATILNLRAVDVPDAATGRLETLAGDATKLNYEDGSFPLVFSNSVIEHLFSYENQKKMAQEVRRTGRSYWVQTPAYGFPIEPHFMALFIHWFPVSVRKKLARRFTLWGLLNRPTAKSVSSKVEEIRLLKRKEIEELFPDAEIYVERFMGWPKSYVAYRKP